MDEKKAMKLKVSVDNDCDYEWYTSDWKDWGTGIVAAVIPKRQGRQSPPGVAWATLWRESPSHFNLHEGGPDKKVPIPYWTDLLSYRQWRRFQDAGDCSFGTTGALHEECKEHGEDCWSNTSEERKNWIMRVFSWNGHDLCEEDDPEEFEDLTVIIFPNISDEERLLYAHRGHSLPEETIVTFAKEVSAVWRGEVWYWSLIDESGEVYDSVGGYTDYEHCESEGQAALEQHKEGERT